MNLGALVGSIAAGLPSHLWQSTLFAAGAGLLALGLLALGLLALGLRRNSARVRFGLWMAASLKFLAPLAPIAAAGRWLPWPQAASAAPMPVLAAVNRAFAPTALGHAAAAAPGVASGASPWVILLIALWLGGIAGVAGTWAWRWRQVAGIVRRARPAAGWLASLPVRVAILEADIEPGLFGILHPVLLLPAGLLRRLSREQLQAVVAHELCHLRRRDNLWAALHVAVQAAFWFHPLVWWLGGRLMEERECACDEAVLERMLDRGGDPEDYAESILAVCRYSLGFQMACSAGLGGGDITRRITRVMSGGLGHRLSLPKKLMLAAAAAAVLGVPLAAGYAGQAAGAARYFDTVSVKPYLPKGPISEACDPRRDPAMLRLTGCTLEQLVVEAYGVKPYQVQLKGPGWIGSSPYVIEGHTAAPANEAEMMQMLQGVLTARFQLVLRREHRPVPAYLLRIASHGPKLTPASAEAHCGQIQFRTGTLSSECLSADDIAEALGMAIFTDRPVVNRTGLPKDQRYRVQLAYAPGTDAAAGPSIFTALPDQLGLAVKAGTAPAEVLVIEGARHPTGN